MQQSLPPGSKILVYVGPDGRCYQVSGGGACAAILPNGRPCACGAIQGWQPCYPGQVGANFQVISAAQAASIAQQMALGASRRGNSFGNVYLPNIGPVGLSERRGNRSPAIGMGLVFTIVLDNTAGLTVARQFLGDYTSTYALLGNTELTPAGFVIGGTWGTQSKAQLIGRTAFRPWSVDKIQFIASAATYYSLANNYYFDTKPTTNGPVKDSLTLTNLLGPNQFNNLIQWYNEEMTLDGINGLDIQIPAGQSITLQFTISAERSAGDQVSWANS